MINLDRYVKQKEPVITRLHRGASVFLNYIGKTNGCETAEEPWTYMTWSRAYENGKPLPKEFQNKIPPDASMHDTFLYSLYDQSTIERILDDAKKDKHIEMMLTLRNAEQELWDKRFPPEL